MAPRDSGSSISPSPQKAQTLPPVESLEAAVLKIPIESRVIDGLIGPSPMETVGNSQKSGISQGCG